MNELLSKISLSVQTFKTHRLRSFLTALGIIIGVSTVIAILSLIDGLNRSVAEQIQSIGSDLVFLSKAPIVIAGPRNIEEIANRPDLTPEDAEAVSQLPSVDIAIPEISQQLTKLSYRDNEVASVRILGSTENFSKVNNRFVESGRDFTRDDITHRRSVCVIGSYVAKNIFPEGSPIGKELNVRGHRLKIIGVFREKGAFLGQSMDNMLVIPYTFFEKMFRRGESVFELAFFGYSVDIKPKSGQTEKTIDEVRELMRRGILPAAKVGGSWRTTRRALYGHLENQMGLESGFHISRRENYPQGVFQIQRRSSAVDKRRKGKPKEPEEIFFPR